MWRRLKSYWIKFKEGEMEEYKRYPIGAIQELSLHIALASYDLSIQDCEGEEVLVEVDDREKANKRIDIEFEDNELRIKQRHRNWDIRDDGEIVLKLPKDRKYSGKCKNGSGDIEITGISYRGVISSASGDIELDSLKDKTELEVKSASGDIKAKKVDGRLEIHSASGNIKVEDVKLEEGVKNAYVETKSAKGFGAFKMLDMDFGKIFSHIPKGVKIREGESREEHISHILKMLKEGKDSAKEAKELIDSLYQEV